MFPRAFCENYLSNIVWSPNKGSGAVTDQGLERTSICKHFSGRAVLPTTPAMAQESGGRDWHDPSDMKSPQFYRPDMLN